MKPELHLLLLLLLLELLLLLLELLLKSWVNVEVEVEVEVEDNCDTQKRQQEIDRRERDMQQRIVGRIGTYGHKEHVHDQCSSSYLSCHQSIQVERRREGGGWAGPSRAEPSQAEPSQAELSQAGPHIFLLHRKTSRQRRERAGGSLTRPSPGAGPGPVLVQDQVQSESRTRPSPGAGPDPVPVQD
ncbi:hypothetical protein INR49_019385, partial [Caranx melampygus]